MKRRITIIVLLSLLVLGFIAFVIVYNQKGFVGDRAAAPDSYRLEIERMTGSDMHTLKLNAGDTLGIQFETAKGSLYMEIKAPDGTTLYTGNGKGKTDFTVNIPESGMYSVHVKAHHAKGRIHIQLKED